MSRWELDLKFVERACLQREASLVSIAELQFAIVNSHRLMAASRGRLRRLSDSEYQSYTGLTRGLGEAD